MTGLAERVRHAERRLGVYRPGRSPWVWILGPGLNAVGTAAVVMWLTADELGWVLTVPLAVSGGAAMGCMAWAFMGTSWDQEQDERAAEELYASSTGRLRSDSSSTIGSGTEGGYPPESGPR